MKIYKVSRTFISWAACLLFLFAYAYFIEPSWIEVTRYSVKLEVPKPIKIAHLSDLHIDSIGLRERKILSILAQEKPDTILISGDSIGEDGNYQAVGEFLEKLSAPLGVWSVNGNWEHWRPAEKEQEVYRLAGIKFLNNTTEKLIDGIWIVGIDDALAGNPDIEKAVRAIPKGTRTLGLFHSPSFFDQTDFKFDLVFSGHTHGGQVRLPFIAPLWLPEGSGRFVSGWYDKGRSKMYVSRGLGNSILDIRFLCRPEISIVEIGQ